jgi:metal-sulfur cluster biosynthetic enzyme
MPFLTVTLNDVVEALRRVYDPELGLNIVDLGLVYGIEHQGGKVHVRMTLTTPGCPVGGSILEGVGFVLDSLPGVEEASIEVVWDPPWSPEMISEEIRRGL